MVGLNLENISTNELKTLLKEINDELKRREEENLENKVLTTLIDEFNRAIAVSGDDDKITRYNGGWTKVITGIDKTKTNGYSLLGDFVNTGVANKKSYWKKGTVFIDCDIGGSRKHQRKKYRLFYLNKDGEMELVATDNTPDYAVNFWDKIEELFDRNREA